MNDKKRIILIFEIILSIITIIVYSFKLNYNIIFIINIVLSFVICFKAKFSLISLQTVLLNYVLGPVFFQYNFSTSYGLLQLDLIPLNYDYINMALFIWNILNFNFIFFTSFLKKESELLKYKPKLKKKVTYIFSTLAILFTIIALPSLPFQTFDTRVVALKALLPGNAWNHLVIILLIFIFSEFKNSKYVKFTYCFVVFWFLSHFERVDMLGLLLMISVLMIINASKKKRKRYIVILFIFGTIMFFGLTAFASIRVNKSVKANELIKSIFVHSTVADIAYTFNSAIQYKSDKGLMYGKTYSAYLIESVPLLNSESRFDKILQKQYHTVGGGYLLGEPIMNFGIIGLVVFKVAELFILYKLVNFKFKIQYFWYVFIFATIFRSIWYGLSYIELGIIYIIPVFYSMAYNTKILQKDNKTIV